MEKYNIYVGGTFTQTNQIISVKNSFDNSEIAQTFLAGKNELETAITKAIEVKDIMKNMPAFLKYDILMLIAQKLNLQKELFAITIAKEACKPLKLATAEVERSIQTFTIAAEESKRIHREYLSLDWTPSGNNKEGLVKYFPIGIVAGIAPFNFPLNLAVHKIAPALAAGCPIILKPSRSTPLSTLLLAKIIDQTELPKGAFSVLPMDREAGNQLVTDNRINLLSFTGSPEVGWNMKNQAGKKRVLLELGGNAGLIVSDSADVETAVKKSVSGAFAYAGQVCIHTQRIFVQDKIFDKFTDLFVEQTKKLVTGKPELQETDFSAMIDLENAIRVEQWINEAQQNGAKVLYGAKRNNTFVEPTIITNTNNNMKVNCCEVFGPVVTIEKYDHFNSAIQQLNNSEFGLQAGVFTNYISEMNLAFNNIEAGGVIINDVPTFRVDHMPYGGIKNSGFGREGVKYSIAEMLEPKLLVKNIL